MGKVVYNTFVVIDCKRRLNLEVTSSARKANSMMRTGVKIEVWNCNGLVETIHATEKEHRPMQPYINAEREYIANKQKRNQHLNKVRRERMPCGQRQI